MKRALITGASGQDGSYLCEHLLEEGYEVHGLVRRSSTPEDHTGRLRAVESEIHLHHGDLLDSSSLLQILEKVDPDEIYNLAAQSHVALSFELPQLTVETNAIGTLNMLEATRRACPGARFYQAGSAEVFGSSLDEDGCQRETTPMRPTSPYGCAKLFAFHIARHYRLTHGLFTANGVLFDHESPRQASNFIANRTTRSAVMIKLGMAERLVLGDLDVRRDWGHAWDYVRAMRAMLAHPDPDDWVIASGESHSVRELCEFVFSKLGLDYRDHVVSDKSRIPPGEPIQRRGDPSRARERLGWSPTYDFETLLEEMIEHWLDALAQTGADTPW